MIEKKRLADRGLPTAISERSLKVAMRTAMAPVSCKPARSAKSSKTESFYGVNFALSRWKEGKVHGKSDDVYADLA